MDLRKAGQPPRVVQAKLDSLDKHAPKEERAMLKWFLKQGNYPNFRHEVRRVVDAKVNVSGNADVSAEHVNFNGESFLGGQYEGLNLTEILSVENPQNSYEYLASLKAPKSYRPIPTFEQLKKSFQDNMYFLTDDDIFTIHQSISLGRALLVSGPSGVGKTEAGRQIALAMGLNVDNPHQYDKLFCTPDIGISESIFQWNNPKRLSDLQLLNGVVSSLGGRLQNSDILALYKEIAANAYGLRYLEIRKLLRACIIPYRTVMLIDEADKPYPTFDNDLLDILQFFRYEIPEYGPLGRATNTKIDHPDNPFFVLTVNSADSGGRDLSPMLMSRCTPLFLKYLPPSVEEKVIQNKCDMDGEDAGKVALFFYNIRTKMKLRQPPSPRETITTAQALVKSQMPVTDKNLLRLNCHWIKNSLDFDTLRRQYGTKDNLGNDVWKETL